MDGAPGDPGVPPATPASLPAAGAGWACAGRPASSAFVRAAPHPQRATAATGSNTHNAACRIDAVSHVAASRATHVAASPATHR